MHLEQRSKIRHTRGRQAGWRNTNHSPRISADRSEHPSSYTPNRTATRTLKWCWLWWRMQDTWNSINVTRTCKNRHYQLKGNHLSHDRQGWHCKIWHDPQRAGTCRRVVLRRQHISSVFNRTGVSSNQWVFSVVHIDWGNTDTKETTLSRILRLWNGSLKRLLFPEFFDSEMSTHSERSWKVSNILIATQNTSRQGTTHVARHYCQATVYYPIPSSPSTHNRVLSSKIPKYLGPQNRIRV